MGAEIALVRSWRILESPYEIQEVNQLVRGDEEMTRGTIGETRERFGRNEATRRKGRGASSFNILNCRGQAGG